MAKNSTTENLNTNESFASELVQAGMQPITWVNRHIATSQGTRKQDFFFRIRKDLLHRGDILVDVVNQAGQPANADSWREVGEAAATLRLMERIRQEQLMRFSWGSENEDEAIRLSQYPYLLLALMRCDNLVTEAMQPIRVSQDVARVQVRLIGEIGKEKKEEEIYQPLFVAKCSEDEAGKPFAMLTDSFLLTGGDKREDGTYEPAVIHPTLSLGENYRQIDFFKRSFPVSVAEQWIAILFTYLTNVELQMEGGHRESG